jgi:hypothetical protein
MKNSLLKTAVVLLVGLASCSKDPAVTPIDQSVPTAVVQAAKAAFPTATQISYTVIKSNSLYVADVQTPGSDNLLILDKAGKITETASTVKESELPKTVTEYLNVKYKGYQLHRAYKKSTGLLGFRVDIVYNKEYFALFFDEAGAVLSEVKGMIGKKGGAGDLPTIRPVAAATQVAFADLPAAVQSALAGYTFKNAIVLIDQNNLARYHVRAEKDGINYDLSLDSAGKTIHSHRENIKDVKFTTTDIPVVPDSIKIFLDKNVKGWTLKKVTEVKKDNITVHYHVKVTVDKNDLTYMFDRSFKQIIISGKDPKDNPAVPNFVAKELTKTKLPSAVVSFLDTNYSGWAVDKAFSISKDGTVSDYTVFYSLKDKKYKVKFDSAGKFKSVRVL